MCVWVKSQQAAAHFLAKRSGILYCIWKFGLAQSFCRLLLHVQARITAKLPEHTHTRNFHPHDKWQKDRRPGPPAGSLLQHDTLSTDADTNLNDGEMWAFSDYRLKKKISHTNAEFQDSYNLLQFAHNLKMSTTAHQKNYKTKYN